MKTSILICIRSLCLFSLLICLPAFVHAQERLQIADLFSKYGEQKDVTRVELNGSILKSYRMTTYKSLVFKNVSPYRREIQQAIVHDKQDNAKKAQEVMESGVLRSAYYQLKEVERNGSQGDVLTCKGRGIQNPFHNSKRKKDYLRMDGQAVFRFAVTTVPRCIRQILKKTETDVQDIKYFILHQANVRILELIAKRLKTDMDKFPMNLDRYGNTSSASIPILLDELNRNHLLERGDKIILSGFGGGLTWGAILIEW